MTSGSVEEYFKDKIDWKFYNYLIGRFTEYEDKTGNNVYITICIDDYENFRDGYIIYNNSNNDKYSELYIHTHLVHDMYNENKLFYVINIVNNSDNSLSETDYTELFSRIKDKANIVENMISNLVVKPK